MNYSKFFFCIPAVALLAACSAKDASKSNFEKALNAKLAKQCIRVNFDSREMASSTFPVPVRLVQKSNFTTEEEANERNKKELAQFDVLVDAGVLTRADGTVKKTYGDGQVPAKVYSLTDEGKKALYKPDRTSLCVGFNEVSDIVNFTEPGKSIDGQTTTHVEYTFSPRDVPKWARAEPVMEAFPELKRLLAENQEDRDNLVLKNDGWAASRRGLF